MTGWLRLGRPDAAALDRLLATARGRELSYVHVGSTLVRDGAPPNTARRVHRRSRELGSGRETFDRAVAALRAWACHAGIGARVFPATAPLVEGESLLVILPVGRSSIVVPNRIVSVVDTPTRFGFAYGTIDGHQERGEESFVVTLGPDGRVTAEITVDAEPSTLAASVGAPLVTWFQHRAVDRYLALG